MKPTEDKIKDVWDVAVIGGGAAGMMAAGRAAEGGARVLLIEKNKTLGKKLLITGGGRCNVTNAEPDSRVFLSKFNSASERADRFLYSPFARHSVSDSLAFFNSRGMETKIEAKNRVFPVSDTAESVWNVLNDYCKAGKVTVLSGSEVVDVSKAEDRISFLTLKNGQRIHAHSYIFSTGGLSRPDTGSTGDGFTWLSKLRHTVSSPNPSLVPLTLRDSWAPSLSGLTLPDVTLSLLEDGKKVAKQQGSLVFTHKGISGPAALNLSKDVGERLPYGPVVLTLDLLPRINLEQLDKNLQETIGSESNKKAKNMLSQLIPSALCSIVLLSAEIAEETPAHSITREERIRLGTVLKNIPLNVKGRLGFEKAIIASGGVSLTEIDTRTMQSRIISNLYIVGDLLNIDRPSGGYSLQLCWTTGAVAGASTAEAVKNLSNHVH